MHCSFPGDRALPALRGRRHDNQHGCCCHSFIAPLSIPSFCSLSLCSLFFSFLVSPPERLSFTVFHIKFSIFLAIIFCLRLFIRLPQPPSSAASPLLCSSSSSPLHLSHYYKLKNREGQQSCFTFTLECVLVCVRVRVLVRALCVFVLLQDSKLESIYTVVAPQTTKHSGMLEPCYK